MPTLTHTATIDASKDQAWAVLADFGGIHRWHFNIESSPLKSPNNEGMGATRVCTFYDGNQVTEAITEYRDGEFMKVAFVEHEMPFHHANIDFTVRAAGPGKSEVTVLMDYEMKFGPLGWLLNKLMIGPVMMKVFERMLEGLNHHTVTGELIGKDGEVQPAVAAG